MVAPAKALGEEGVGEGMEAVNAAMAALLDAVEDQDLAAMIEASNDLNLAWMIVQQAVGANKKNQEGSTTFVQTNAPS